MYYREIERDAYKVCFEEPEVYVDNRQRGRSGHMTHAMVEFAPGKIIDFNANCSANRCCGHSVYGWVEYRIGDSTASRFSQVYDFPYSRESFLDGLWTISVGRFAIGYFSEYEKKR